MTTTTFVDQTTVIPTAWLNDTNTLVYAVFSAATSAALARTAIGLGTMATQAASAVAITGGTITGITDITVADGGTGLSALTANNVILGNGTAAVQLVAPSTSGNVLTSNGTTWSSTAPASATVRSYLAGCTMSTAGSSATMSIAAGTATDSTNTVSMALTAIAKTTSAWAVGNNNGGIDTGSIANSTWYHFYVIQRSDTGVVDVMFSTSASAPTLPTNYTYYRRIGSGKTNGSAQWTKFVQFGDEFLWDTELTDVSSIATSATAASKTLTVPTGIQVWARIRANLGLASGSESLFITSLDESDQAASLSTGGALGKGTFECSSGFQGNGECRVRTNTSAQIRVRSFGTAAFFSIFTYGWVDERGKSA